MIDEIWTILSGQEAKIKIIHFGVRSKLFCRISKTGVCYSKDEEKDRNGGTGKKIEGLNTTCLWGAMGENSGQLTSFLLQLQK